MVVVSGVTKGLQEVRVVQLVQTRFCGDATENSGLGSRIAAYLDRFTHGGNWATNVA